MKEYNSPSSFIVRMITIVIMIVSGIVVFSTFTFNSTYGTIGGVFISLIILATLAYFFANSLKKVIVKDKKIKLQKNIGQIEIPFSDVVKIERLQFSNLTMTYGSMGVFGYVGNTMDNSISMVNDRRKMVRIITIEKKYTISCEEPEKMINEVKKLLQTEA